MPFKNPVNGNNVQLTLDLEYQSILEEELFKRQIETGAISATGIILNPQNGEILALGSTPDLIITSLMILIQIITGLRQLLTNLSLDQPTKLYRQFLL